ncbi:hypothetical protein V6N13_106567 [Hibiscus sabdariffa]|uniref:Uncharacterized protein n=1 Tax=Hibiscus sabdariffa TaxID=183260 RepID=A0ABR2F140_9ROSI
MGYDEATTAKQPTREPKTIVAARLAALTTMVETIRAQLEELKTDLRTYFKYVQERYQVIRANFNEMLPQSPLDFSHFPQDLLKPTEAKVPEAQNEPAEHTPNPPQDKPLGSDSTSSSPTPPVHTPQIRSPLAQTNKGKAPRLTPPTPPFEVDIEDTLAMEVEDIEITPRSEEEVQSSAAEDEEPAIIPPTHPMSIKHKATNSYSCIIKDLGGWWPFLVDIAVRKVVCGCFLCKKVEELKVKLERRGSCSNSVRQCGMMLILQQVGLF